jgi:hypothetical protein
VRVPEMDSEAAARWCPGRGRWDGGDDRWVPAVSDSGRRRGAAGSRGPAELGQVGHEAALGRCTGGSGRAGWRARLLGQLAAAGCCWAWGWAAWPDGLDREKGRGFRNRV